MTTRILSYLAVPALLAFGACTEDYEQFLGTWAYQTGSSFSLTCPGGTTSSAITGNDRFSEGIDSDLVIIDPDNCNFKANVSGNRADGIPGQTCMIQDPNGVITLTANSGSYTLSNGILSFASAGGVTQAGTTCTYTSTGTLKKVAN